MTSTTVLIWISCGIITLLISRKKNGPSPFGSFLLGLLLGPIGIIIALLEKPQLPKAPKGMRAVECPRCRAVQNVPDGQRVYECWQCKSAQELWGAPVSVAADPGQQPPAVLASKIRCHTCEHVQSVPVSKSTFVCEQCGAKLKRKVS
jgi:hypothetical protein